MKKEDILKGMKDLVRESEYALKNNLKGIIMFGSGNNLNDFIPGLSDLDFIYVVEVINYDILQKCAKIRNKVSISTGIKIDIKLFTHAEFKAAIECKGSFELFTGWGLEVILNGEQQCIYNNGEFLLDYTVSKERIKKDALDRAHYYIGKLRKLFGSNEQILLRGEIKSPDMKDKLKLSASAVKNVLVFCLAYQGIIVSNYSDVTKYAQNTYGAIPEIIDLFEHKKEIKYDEDIIWKAYDKIERIYKETIQK